MYFRKTSQLTETHYCWALLLIWRFFAKLFFLSGFDLTYQWKRFTFNWLYVWSKPSRKNNPAKKATISATKLELKQLRVSVSWGVFSGSHVPIQECFGTNLILSYIGLGPELRTNLLWSGPAVKTFMSWRPF